MAGSLALSIVIIICVCKFSATVTGRQTPWSIQGPKAWSVLYNNSNYGKFQLNNGVGQTLQKEFALGWKNGLKSKGICVGMENARWRIL